MSDRLLINLSFLQSQPTGLGIYAKNLIPQLRVLSPTLLTANAFTDFTCELIPPYLSQDKGTKGHFKRLLWTQFQLSKRYRQLKGALLFSPVPEAPIYTNCRYIVTVHDLIPLRFSRRFSALTAYYRYYLPFVLNQAQHIITNSQTTANDLVEIFNIAATKITPILLAYDAERFQPINLENQPFPSVPPYFLYMGRYDPHKNLSRLIRAFAAIPNRQDCQLWLVGSPDERYRPILAQLATDLAVKSAVKFIDYLPNEALATIINQAIALVFPSLWEGFGLPVLEAMACGTAVITSNLSSLAEVTGQEAAMLVNPYNVAEISTAMTTMLHDTGIRDHFSQLGLKRASQFSWEETGKQTVEVLSQFL